MAKALFLDRDGVINVDRGYVHHKDDFEFVEGIFDLCRAAVKAGYLIIVATNQSGIERGYFTEGDFAELTDWMKTRFAAEGSPIAAVYHCPSLSGPDRKPNPGMFLKAQAAFGLNMSECISVGDSPRDAMAATAAGIADENNYLLGGGEAAFRSVGRGSLLELARMFSDKGKEMP